MLSSELVILVSLIYVGLLYAIAWWGDKRARDGHSWVRNPTVYTLSIAVYCTSWTFYGAVGTAARNGLEYLTIYLGPTVVFLGWWFLLRKMLRISKAHRITSIADFISSRYGKSTQLSVLVTLIAVIGTTPYIALQLKAIATSYTVLTGWEFGMVEPVRETVSIFSDSGFWAAVGLTLFGILFGTRFIDADEHHEGMVAAIAFESLVKLFALLAVGFFVSFVMYDGLGDLFTQSAENAATAKLLMLPEGGSSRWLTLMMLSMAAILCLPRQFQVIIVENVDERHLATASWAFPLYLLAMNLFVLPIALAGLGALPVWSDPDFFVISVPLFEDQSMLALLAYVGGLSASTSMVIVATIALSTMVCNDLIVPALLRIRPLRLTERDDLTGLLIFIRRASIVVVVFMGFAYYRSAGASDALAEIGLISFAAIAQFIPIMIGGLYWKGGTRTGAQVALTLGFAVWGYTLLLPSLADSGWMDPSLILNGAFGHPWLRPESLFGLTDFAPLTHALIWSISLNTAAYVLISLFTEPSALERIQATLFVDAFSRKGQDTVIWRSSASANDLYELVERFLGRDRAYQSFRQFDQSIDPSWRGKGEADADMIAFTERLLAGSIGAASARVMVSSVAKGEMVSLDEVLEILEETSHVIEYSQRLETKSRELEKAAAELRAANERLKELDRLKDEFLTMVSHEFRTPLTSIRSFSEILVDSPNLDPKQADHFLEIIVRESERLTRLIDDHLDLARLEAGHSDWRAVEVDPRTVLDESIDAVKGLFNAKGVVLTKEYSRNSALLHVDRDRLTQVFINLLSNAAKFSAPDHPEVSVRGEAMDGGYLVSITDNGKGVAPNELEIIFDKFSRGGKYADDKPKPSGSGLGLAIAKHVVEHCQGKIWAESPAGRGATFRVFIPGTIMEAIKPAKPASFGS
ncbi:sensor histidine kinase [Thalassospira tepidiphila]|uniref:histidine kinase n=3 Tax=Thalassospira TaxID=168934 RepID=A0A853KZ87_9PROT|nr:sensor histidine kinase [Thalassospira tepidiphila]NJB76346.1 Na+/proline symporter/nitrogen-specific signal transduction histidine kinase [Thalassospira tepidiphila]OAZ09684.1 histidine kinase [Thalassospira tepidiphila MCCC 1A03514]